MLFLNAVSQTFVEKFRFDVQPMPRCMETKEVEVIQR